MMKKVLVFLLCLFQVAPAFAQDALDLHAVAMPHSPPVADWAQTVRITQLDMDPRGGIALTFDQPIPERWKWFSNPAEPSDNFQFTVWACVQRTYCAGFVQMWAGRSMTDGSLPAILSGYSNWWGDVRHLWDNMSDYRPQPGDEVDFLVTAGNGRLVSGVTSVAERSNVVAIRLPAGDSGHFVFSPAAPVPSPTPAPPPVIVYVPPPAPPPVVTPVVPSPQPPGLDLSNVAAQLAALKDDVDASRAENQAFYKEARTTVGDVLMFVTKYILPSVAGLVAGHQLAK